MRTAVVAVAVLLLAIGAGIKYTVVRHELIEQRKAMSEAWKQVDPALQRLAELVPALVASLKAVCKGDNPVFKDIEEARAALGRLHQYYLLHPVPGGWYDQFDDNGRSLVDFIPASSFYHVLCAVAEAEQVLS